MTFYDDWLGMWQRATDEKKSARKVTHEEDIEWVETVQDYKVGLLIAPELGFRTWGTESLIAEIPPGCHTGKHKHGEESIHIVEGSGFSIINGVRYDWKKGGTLVVPVRRRAPALQYWRHDSALLLGDVGPPGTLLRVAPPHAARRTRQNHPPAERARGDQ